MGLSWTMQATFFAICLLWIVKTSEEYLKKKVTIYRPSLQNMSSGFVDGIRLTGVSAANLASKDFPCEDFNAEPPSGVNSIYQCKCTNEASTFSYFGGQWKCVDNEDFRQKEGKSPKFILSCVYDKAGLTFSFGIQPIVSVYD